MIKVKYVSLFFLRSLLLLAHLACARTDLCLACLPRFRFSLCALWLCLVGSNIPHLWGAGIRDSTVYKDNTKYDSFMLLDRCHCTICTMPSSQDFSTIGSWLPDELDKNSPNNLLVRKLSMCYLLGVKLTAHIPEIVVACCLSEIFMTGFLEIKPWHLSEVCPLEKIHTRECHISPAFSLPSSQCVPFPKGGTR